MKDASNPFAFLYEPKVDISKPLEPVMASYYQYLIGNVGWEVELGCIYIETEVSMLLSHNAYPHGGTFCSCFAYYVLIERKTQLYPGSWPDLSGNCLWELWYLERLNGLFWWFWVGNPFKHPYASWQQCIPGGDGRQWPLRRQYHQALSHWFCDIFEYGFDCLALKETSKWGISCVRSRFFSWSTEWKHFEVFGPNLGWWVYLLRAQVTYMVITCLWYIITWDLSLCWGRNKISQAIIKRVNQWRQRNSSPVTLPQLRIYMTYWPNFCMARSGITC